MAKQVKKSTEEKVQAIIDLAGDVLTDLGVEVEVVEEKPAKETKKRGRKTKEEVVEPEIEEDTRETEEVELDPSDLDDMDADELKAFAKENEISLKKLAPAYRKNADKLKEFILAELGVEEEVEEDSEEDEEDSDEDEVDLDSMSLKELKAFAKDNDVKIAPKYAKDADKIKGLIIEALGEEEDETEEEAEESEEEEVDLDEMSLKELLAFAKESDIEIPVKIKKNEEKVRALIEESLPDEEDSEEDEVDLESMSLKELKAFAEANDIDLSDLSKAELKDAATVREAIQSAMLDESEDAEEDEFEPSDERLEAEAKLETALKKNFASKKLKLTAMKAELENYMSEDCVDCKKCDEKTILNCYIQMRKGFIDDEGESFYKADEDNKCYERNGVLWCCGTECLVDPDNEDQLVCPICAEIYELGEE